MRINFVVFLYTSVPCKVNDVRCNHNIDSAEQIFICKYCKLTIIRNIKVIDLINNNSALTPLLIMSLLQKWLRV